MSARKGRPRSEALPLAERLFARCIPEPNSGCWLWEGSTNTCGYGTIGIGSRGQDRRTIQTHRAAWLATHGDLPPGKHVLHRCDTPACINPAHLFLGGPLENMRDMAAKGRGVYPGLRGAQHWASKLTEDQVRQIVARLPAGESYAAIAKDYGVTEAAILPIARGRGWTHITGIQQADVAPRERRRGPDGKYQKKTVLTMIAEARS